MFSFARLYKEIFNVSDARSLELTKVLFSSKTHRGCMALKRCCSQGCEKNTDRKNVSLINNVENDEKNMDRNQVTFSNNIGNDSLETQENKDSEFLKIDKEQNVLSKAIWNEHYGVKRAVKKEVFYRNLSNIIDLQRQLQIVGTLPKTFTGLLHVLKNRIIRKQILQQQFLPQRHGILKPDLAAAHFLVTRGGSVKFVGQTQWVGSKKNEKNTLPVTFVPGYFIEAINAEGTNLYREGFENLCDLKYLKWLSLKGLENVNDWCLDWVASQYYSTLEHLDISDCKGITYRGLSCFYRFQTLKTLIVKGVSDSAEFKVACLMLLDIMPELEIVGIKLTIPEKIELPDKEASESFINDKEKLKVLSQ